MKKFRVSTNHGTFTFKAVDSADARRQAENLTYGSTRVNSVDAIAADGRTGAEVAVEKAAEAKLRRLGR